MITPTREMRDKSGDKLRQRLDSRFNSVDHLESIWRSKGGEEEERRKKEGRIKGSLLAAIPKRQSRLIFSHQKLQSLFYTPTHHLHSTYRAS